MSTTSSESDILTSLCPVTLALLLASRVNALTLNIVWNSHPRATFVNHCPAAILNGRPVIDGNLLAEVLNRLTLESESRALKLSLLAYQAIVDSLEYTLWCNSTCYEQYTRRTYVKSSLPGRYYVDSKRREALKRLGLYTHSETASKLAYEALVVNLRYLKEASDSRLDNLQLQSVEAILLASALLVIRGIPVDAVPWKKVSLSSSDPEYITGLIDEWLPRFERALISENTIDRRPTVSHPFEWNLIEPRPATSDHPSDEGKRISLFDYVRDSCDHLKKPTFKGDVALGILGIASLVLFQTLTDRSALS